MKTLTKLYEARNFKVDKKYTHFCVENASGKIVDGWDYKGTDEDSIKEYYKNDMKDNERPIKDYKLIKKEKLVKDGIDPFSWDNWKNMNESVTQYPIDTEKIKIGDKITSHKMTMVIRKITNSTFIGNRIDPKTGAETNNELRMDKSMFSNSHYMKGIEVDFQ